MFAQCSIIHIAARKGASLFFWVKGVACAHATVKNNGLVITALVTAGINHICKVVINENVS